MNTRYIPNNAKEIKRDGLNGVVYTYEGDTDTPYALAYSGKRTTPIFTIAMEACVCLYRRLAIDFTINTISTVGGVRFKVILISAIFLSLQRCISASLRNPFRQIRRLENRLQPFGESLAYRLQG